MKDGRQTVTVKGLPWPIRVNEVSAERLALLPDDTFDALSALWVTAADGGPSTRSTFIKWLEMHLPSHASVVLAAALGAQHITMRQRLMLRILGSRRADDGVSTLSFDAETYTALGFDVSRPMPTRYSTLWDTNGPEVRYTDEYVTADGKGVGCFVHPSRFVAIEPALRRTLAIGDMVAGPPVGVSYDEFRRLPNHTCEGLMVMRAAQQRSR